MATKTENWKGWGRVNVSRDARGRFVHWELIKNLIRSGKAVSIYGRCKTKLGEYSGRYDFEYGSPSTGTITELKKAIAFSLHFPPKRRHVTVPVRLFNERPSNYGTEGYWVDRPDINS